MGRLSHFRVNIVTNIGEASVATQVFSTLNALRGVAAISVVTAHWRAAFNPIYAHSGYLAVDLFFLLSGFVIAFSYDGRIQTTWTFSQFLRVRLVRLYPMYILGVCITLLGIFALDTHDRMAASWSEIGRAFLCNGLMLPAFPMGKADTVFPLNSPAWTLYLELLCNLIYACFHRFAGPRNLLFCMALSASGLVAVVQLFGDLNLGFDNQSFFAGFFRAGFSFSAGILLCRAYRAKLLPRFRAPGLFILLACVGILLHQPLNRPLFDLLCVFLLFPAIIVVGVHSPTPAALADFLGNISYPLYAIHMPMLGIILILCEEQAQPALAGTALLCLLLVIGISWMLDRWIDRPLRAKWSMKQRQSQNRRPLNILRSVRPM